MLKRSFLLVITMFLFGCNEYSSKKTIYEYEVLFINHSGYDIDNVFFYSDGASFGGGFLSNAAFKCGKPISIPLKDEILCTWEVNGKKYKKILSIPQYFENGFTGTVAFLFHDGTVTMEYDNNPYISGENFLKEKN